jgi:hypothetical protein
MAHRRRQNFVHWCQANYAARVCWMMLIALEFRLAMRRSINGVPRNKIFPLGLAVGKCSLAAYASNATKR